MAIGSSELVIFSVLVAIIVFVLLLVGLSKFAGKEKIHWFIIFLIVLLFCITAIIIALILR